MGASAIYAATVAMFQAQISTANTNRDGTGTIVDVCVAGTNGTRIDDLSIVATGATTAGIIRFFLYDGSVSRLWKEIPVGAVTPSGTVTVWSLDLRDLALILKNGWKLQASTHNAETFNIIGTRAGDI